MVPLENWDAPKFYNCQFWAPSFLILANTLLSMLRLLSYKAREYKDFRKLSKPGQVGIHWMALAEYSHISTHAPRFQTFFQIFCIIFFLAKLATVQ